MILITVQSTKITNCGCVWQSWHFTLQTPHNFCPTFIRILHSRQNDWYKFNK